MENRFVIRKNRLFFFFALAITVGTPNLDEFDTTGITRGIEAFGIVAPTFLWRVLVFFYVGSTTVLIFAYSISSNTTHRRVGQFGYCWLLYIWLAISSIITFPTFFDLSLAMYRLMEWGIALLVTLMLFSTPQRQAINIFSHFLRLAPLLALGLLGLICLHNPSLTYFFSPTKEAFRLGGIAMPPNSIGLLFGFGALYWCVTGRNNKLWTLITFVLFSACLLTWSRSGIGGTCFAAILYIALRKLSLKNISHTSIFIIIITVLPIIFLYNDIFISYILRGEDIDYILNAAGRFDVWREVCELFKKSPFFGHGFIFGPKLLMYSSLIPSHWRPAHAHNDILNMSIAGGIIGVIILTIIYYKTIKNCYIMAKSEPLLIATFCGLFVSNIFETGLSTSFGIRGFLMIALFRIVTLKSNPHS